MKSVLSLFTAILVSIIFPGGLLRAQVPLTEVPTTDQIRVLLGSADAKNQAWGAWWVAQANIRNMEALLQANLKAHLNGHTIEDDAVIDTTLDAMIQIGGSQPPLDLLQSVYAVRPAQGLILLSRAFPREPADAFLLTLLEKEAGRGQGLEWFAAANILTSHRAVGLEAALLRGLEIQATLLVCDRGRPCESSRSGSAGVGDGPGARISGLPPWPAYFLTSSTVFAGIGSMILASGPIPISYQRDVFPSGIGPMGVNYPRGSETRNPSSPTTAERLKYVAAAAPGLQMPILDDESRIIEFQDYAAFAAEVENFRKDIAGRYSILLQRLRSAGLLSAEDAGMLSRQDLNMIVEDRRAVRNPRIPAISSH